MLGRFGRGALVCEHDVLRHGGSFLGDAGTSVGWALMQSLAILTGNLAGLFSGEWRDASPASRRTMWLGLSCLLAGVFIVAFSK